jgi:hypothetical protein
LAGGIGRFVRGCALLVVLEAVGCVAFDGALPQPLATTSSAQAHRRESVPRVIKDLRRAVFVMRKLRRMFE